MFLDEGAQVALQRTAVNAWAFGFEVLYPERSHLGRQFEKRERCRAVCLCVFASTSRRISDSPFFCTSASCKLRPRVKNSSHSVKSNALSADALDRPIVPGSIAIIIFAESKEALEVIALSVEAKHGEEAGSPSVAIQERVYVHKLELPIPATRIG